MAENPYGNIAPINNPENTNGSVIVTSSIVTIQYSPSGVAS